MFSRAMTRRWGMATLLICVLGLATTTEAKPDRAGRGPRDHDGKFDEALRARADQTSGSSRVIVVLKPGTDTTDGRRFGGVLRRRLQLIDGAVVDLPNAALRELAGSAEVESIHEDRPVVAHLNRVAVTVGARAVQNAMGLDGRGIGVAVIDSGVTSWHDDLSYERSKGPRGQRVSAFVDFVNGRPSAYDDYGHGTHVAGIIAGNGYDTGGLRAGIAPAAQVVSLKVLDDQGQGTVSGVIAALEWAVANRSAYNIRVINLSVGAAVTESFLTDPLTLAAKHAVDAGIVVVSAAGNFGKAADGQPQYRRHNRTRQRTLGAHGRGLQRQRHRDPHR